MRILMIRSNAPMPKLSHKSNQSPLSHSEFLDDLTPRAIAARQARMRASQIIADQASACAFSTRLFTPQLLPPPSTPSPPRIPPYILHHGQHRIDTQQRARQHLQYVSASAPAQRGLSFPHPSFANDDLLLQRKQHRWQRTWART